jgi:cell division protein FtsI/penicillin-binding protein 2
MNTVKQFTRRHFLGLLLGLFSGWFYWQRPAKTIAAQKAKAFMDNLPKGVSLAWTEQGGSPIKAGSVSRSLPLGSVMKLFTTAVLLETNTVNRDTLFECRGTTRIPGSTETVHCLKPHGKINLTQALGYSCNGYFVQSSAKLPFEQWQEQLLKWGVPVHEKASEKDSKAPKYLNTHHYIGLTPSVMMTPVTLLPLIEDLAFATGWANMISPETRQVLREGMMLAAREGTGKHLPTLKQGQMALKTGTVPYQKHFQSWAVGFFPASKAEFVFVLQDPRGSSQDKAVGSLKQWLLKTFPNRF